MEEIFREIKIDEENSLMFSEKFWSPKGKRNNTMKTYSFESKISEKEAENTNNSIALESKISHVKLNKSASSLSLINASDIWKYNQTITNIR